MKMLLMSLLICVVVLHLMILIINIAAVFVLPFTGMSIFIWIPLETFLVGLVFNSSWKCPMTIAENKIRKALGMRQISGFIGHYFMKPIYIMLDPEHKRSVLSDN